MPKYSVNCLATIALSIWFLTACEPPQQTQTQPTPATAQTPAPPAATPAAPPVAATQGPFTFPILDALLHDDEFLKEVRSSIGIKDTEIEDLKKAAVEGVADLDESDAAERSASERSSDAKARIKQILGDDRGQRLIALVQQKWSSGTSSEKPNSVPADSRIVVNIPAFRMDVFDKGKLVKTYKIGIGYPEFPLPTGLREAKQIIVNPSWTPPDEPWVRGKLRPFEKVEAGSKLNPLGVIKIPIGLPSLIHGGKSPQRLGTFASHGCGQVEDFAVQLSTIGGKPITLQEIKALEKVKTETKTIDLSTDVPVELRYETIMLENGTLKIFRDVYERGTNTEENLRRLLEAQGLSLDQLDESLRTQILTALEEMGTDAAGKPIDGVTANANANTKANASNTKPPRITRNINGQKEAAFVIPQLAGKGYPAPVNLRAT
jgi:lipoprotein-anchoring transpeptidase ErfK/SrfK